MEILKTLEVIRRKRKCRLDAEEVWRTIRGARVRIKDGEIVDGPDALKAWSKSAPSKKSKISGKSPMEVSDSIWTNYKIDLSSFQFMDHMSNNPGFVEVVKSTCDGLDAVLDEIPELKGEINNFQMGGTAVLTTSGNSVFFNRKLLNDPDEAQKMCDEYSKKGHWHKNSSPASLMAHEMGHALEHKLIEKVLNYRRGSQGFSEALNNSEIAGRIVEKAADEIGGKMPELQKSISLYATKNYSETLAEAMADCYANGDNATPFSKAIKKEALRLLRE